MSSNRRRRWVRWSLLGTVAILACVVARPAYLWTSAWWRDRPAIENLPPGHVDDASRLNRTRVTEVWPVPADSVAAEEQLRQLFLRAAAEGKRISIAGTRHSMGGHTIYPDGIVLDMLPLHHLELNAQDSLLTAGAGARWNEVVPYLDSLGFSPGVMQSNNDFSLGGSVSVNCHGWQPNSPPISSTVESLRVMLADGTILPCSRQENAELFSHVLGGYGLFGPILTLKLRVVPNERYTAETELVPAAKYVERFSAKLGKGNVGMAYGRLCVVPGDDSFLQEALLTVFHRSPCEPSEIPKLGSLDNAQLRREIHRAQIGSDAGKVVRWRAERTLGEQLAGAYYSRNQLLNEGAAVYQEQNADRTDVLHEYFIPGPRVEDFLRQARSVIPRHGGDLLNVTIRNVLRDDDTVLRYADADMFGFVMLYSQERTKSADERMAAMTRDLVDAAVSCQGRHYLTYRLHADVRQFEAAYPQAAAFFARKRHYDPGELFQNQFYLQYGRPAGG